MNQRQTQLSVIAALSVLLVVVSGALAAKTFKTWDWAPKTPAAPANVNAPSVNENRNPSPENIPERGKEFTFLTELPAFKEPSEKSLAKTKPLEVDWLTQPQKIEIEYLNSSFGVNDSGSLDEVTLFKTGSVHGGEYAGNDLIYISYAEGEMGGPYYRGLFISVPAEKKIILLGRYLWTYKFEGQKLAYPNVLQFAANEPDWQIEDLAAPEKITVKGGYSATRVNDPIGLNRDNSTPRKIGETADGIDLYAWGSNPSILLKDHELISYSLDIPFYLDKRIPNIRWSDGSKNAADYVPFAYGSCGLSSSMNISDGLLSSDIKGAGKTSNGETVYLPKNADFPDLRKIYEEWFVWRYNSNGVYQEDSTKPSFETFLSMKPIFFWKDPFGRMVKWTRGDVMPMAECGKPVIYLYPTQKEDVSVKLGSNIEVTKSEPEYGNGWKVTAQPDGTLTDANGTYPYLYWDGNGASYEAPKQGWSVKASDADSFLSSKLAELGLNAKEAADFKEFWMPIVTKSPYALISFVPQSEWSKAAPLAISPAPQTLIRVFMDWKPLSAPVSIEPQVLPPAPERTGFTAIEWGGLLYK